MSELNHVGLWNRCLEIIRDNVPEQTYKTWFLPIIPLKYEDKTLVVQVPSQFFYEFWRTSLLTCCVKLYIKLLVMAPSYCIMLWWIRVHVLPSISNLLPHYYSTEKGNRQRNTASSYCRFRSSSES